MPRKTISRPRIVKRATPKRAGLFEIRGDDILRVLDRKLNKSMRPSKGMRMHIRLEKAGLRQTDSGRLTRESPKLLQKKEVDPKHSGYFGKILKRER